MAEALKCHDIDDLRQHSVRNRMRFIDTCITELLSAIHLFIGAKRPDAFYDSRVASDVPNAIQVVKMMLTLLESMEPLPPPPPPGEHPAPRHHKRTFEGDLIEKDRRERDDNDTG